MIEELKTQTHKGLRIGIDTSIEGEYTVKLANIISDSTAKWAENELKMEKEEMLDFIQKYSEKYEITKNEKPFIESKEGIDLSIITDELEKDLEEQGIEINKLLDPNKEEKNIENEVVLEQLENLDTDKNNQQMIEYKAPNKVEQIISMIKDKVLNVAEKFKGIFNKKEEVEDKEEKPQEKNINSWDLRNWDMKEVAAENNRANEIQKDVKKDKNIGQDEER